MPISGHRQQITTIVCGSAVGKLISPFIILVVKQLNYLLMKDEILGSHFAVSGNGWLDHDLFFPH